MWFVYRKFMAEQGANSRKFSCFVLQNRHTQQKKVNRFFKLLN